MKFSQNTKVKRKRYYGTNIYYIDFTENEKKLHFGCSVSFDGEQHKGEQYQRVKEISNFLMWWTPQNDPSMIKKILVF